MNKRILCLLLAAMMVMALFTGCGDSKAPAEEPAEEPAEAPAEEPAEEPAESIEKQDLIVFAAASLQESRTELSSAYMAAHPEINIVLSFDSSGTLRKQIEEGSPCDIFISASPKHMNLIDASCDEEKNPDKQDYVLEGTRFNILENKVVLAVPEGNPKGIEGFEDLMAKLQSGEVLFAMGNEDVPVGKYTSKILAHFGVDEKAVASCITYGSNVKEVASQITEAAVDCGCIYLSDATSAGLDYVETATEDMCGKVIYPAAVLNISEHQDEAKAFLDFLDSADGDAAFEAVGFVPYTEG